MKLPTITALVGFETESDGSKVTFQFKSSDGRSHYLPIKASVLNAFAPVMLNVIKGTEGGDEVQPTTLTSARGARMGDGTPILALGLDGVATMVAVGQDGAIPKLLEILNRFQSEESESHARH